MDVRAMLCFHRGSSHQAVTTWTKGHRQFGRRSEASSTRPSRRLGCCPRGESTATLLESIQVLPALLLPELGAQSLDKFPVLNVVYALDINWQLRNGEQGFSHEQVIWRVRMKIISIAGNRSQGSAVQHHFDAHEKSGEFLVSQMFRVLRDVSR